MFFVHILDVNLAIRKGKKKTLETQYVPCNEEMTETAHIHVAVTHMLYMRHYSFSGKRQT